MGSSGINNNKELEIECRHLINSNQEVMNSSSCG